MNAQEQSLAHFLSKWRTRWPEWAMAEVFVPPGQRATAVAWFALRGELADAAWAGADPRPGELKLAWWAEELQGWTQGRRRHPLGTALQRHAAPWAVLAARLPALQASRERPLDADEAMATLEPVADAIAAVADVLFGAGDPAPVRGTVAGLLAERLLAGGEAAVPLQVLARLPADRPDGAAGQAWAQDLLQAWPGVRDGTRPGRLHAAMVRARLQGHAAARSAPVPPWRMLWQAWRAARS